MTLWIILTLMACVATLWIAIPLIRRFEEQANERHVSVAVFEGQLRDIERDVSADVIAASAAEATRIDVQRRMIAAAKAEVAARPLSPAWRGLALVSTTGFVALASVLLYAKLGSPTLQPAVNAVQPDQQSISTRSVGNVDELVVKLEARLAANPSDAEGWRMLGWSYFSTQRYTQAAEAYRKAMTADPGNADYRASYAEALVQANQGIVTPDAAEAFAQALKVDPNNLRARFYEALHLEQGGEKQASLDAWIKLAGEAPSDAGWLVEVRSHITSLGKSLGQDVTAFAAANPPSGAAGVPVISKDDVSAIQSLPANDQQAMIRGMVDGLAAKLEANPRDADGWIRLMRSRMVLQEPEKAGMALSKALSVFADDATAQATLKAAATEFGIQAN